MTELVQIFTDDVSRWTREQRERRGWSKAELGRRIGVTGPAIGLFESGDRRPRPQVLAKLVAIFGAKSDGEDIDLDDIAHVSESLARPAPERIRIGIPATWDAAIYIAHQPLLFANGIDCEFDVLPGWDADPLEHLVDGRYDALIHNRFLLASARQANRNIEVRMTAPLYAYRGQFIFVRRDFVQQVIQEDVSNDDERVLLESFLDEHYNITEATLGFPRLMDTKCRSRILKSDKARFAYVPGTDLEEALKQLWDSASQEGELADSQPSVDGQSKDRQTWLERDWKIDDCRKLCLSARNNDSPNNLLSILYDGFKNEGKYNVFCGGLYHLWDLARHPEIHGKCQYLTISDPKERDTPSLNGIIALEDTALSKGDALDKVAASFYAGARLTKDWYQSIRLTDGDIVRGGTMQKFNSLHLRNIFNFATTALPVSPNDEEETRIPTIQEVWAWARLMFRYVDFFTSPKEANAASVEPEARVFATSVAKLAENVSKE